ncbi:MAG: DsbA family protein [Methyloceanibacter sp.]|uniref:DsbA family protein n=1 Tax=Methyloceanibacter sp. TaxID=1965321 RepID=UPI003D6CCAB2
MAKPEKKPTEASTVEAGSSKTGLIVAGAVAALAIVAGVIYFAGFGTADPNAPKGDPDTAALMQEGPLKDIVIGEADAPYTIVEYASMTCSHCAHFHTDVFPELKEKYIDTGKARYMLREFPLDGLAVAAFMLARCAGDDRYYPLVGGMFETQETWAVPGDEGKQKLLLIAKQAGFSQEAFDKCLADKELFDKIVEVRKRAHEEFGVDATPAFFINGKRLKGGYELKNFEAVIDGGSAEDTPPSG